MDCSHAGVRSDIEGFELVNVTRTREGQQQFIVTKQFVAANLLPSVRCQGGWRFFVSEHTKHGRSVSPGKFTLARAARGYV